MSPGCQESKAVHQEIFALSPAFLLLASLARRLAVHQPQTPGPRFSYSRGRGGEKRRGIWFAAYQQFIGMGVYPSATNGKPVSITPGYPLSAWLRTGRGHCTR